MAQKSNISVDCDLFRDSGIHIANLKVNNSRAPYFFSLKRLGHPVGLLKVNERYDVITVIVYYSTISHNTSIIFKSSSQGIY